MNELKWIGSGHFQGNEMEYIITKRSEGFYVAIHKVGEKTSVGDSLQDTLKLAKESAELDWGADPNSWEKSGCKSID